MTKGIFIPQIHEKAEFALIVQRALHDEFAGMIPVFMSSDEVSVGADSEFMRRVEADLRDCCGAIFLVSSVSLCRPWVNFELGAVWARNMLLPLGGQRIPRTPLCHSGLLPTNLPPPLGMLDASLASNAGDLRRMFLALEAATGRTPSRLRTDFVKLADGIAQFERLHSETRNAKEIIRLGGVDLEQLRQDLTQQPKRMVIPVGCIVESHEVGNMRAALRSMDGAIKNREQGQEHWMSVEENGAKFRSGTSFAAEFPRRLAEFYSLFPQQRTIQTSCFSLGRRQRPVLVQEAAARHCLLIQHGLRDRRGTYPSQIIVPLRRSPIFELPDPSPCLRA